MSIPFTQYLLPNGRRKPISIDRPAEIEALAAQFRDAGGWYDAEVLTTGQVSLTAGFHVDDEEQDVAYEIVDNGPGIAEAVDRLVRKSVEFLATVR